jgi:hypothetical protein
VKRRPDFVVFAQRYVDCAFVHISLGERALNEKDRLYHAAAAREYLLLAESELKTARVHAFGRPKTLRISSELMRPSGGLPTLADWRALTHPPADLSASSNRACRP